MGYISNGTSGMPNGCAWARWDSGCGFDTTSSLAKGTVALQATTSGTVTASVSLAHLESACNGKTLRLRLVFNETAQSCSGSNYCTLEGGKVDTDLVSPSALTCTVASGSCTISATLNSSSYPVMLSNQLTGLEVRNVEVWRSDNPAGPSFTMGLRVQ